MLVGTNPAIANAFAYMKIIEKWGTGIPRRFRECTEYGLPEPELIDFDGDFRVNMYRKSLISEKQVTDVTEKVTDVTEKVTGIEVKILELISNDPVITTSKLANMLSVTRKTKFLARYHEDHFIIKCILIDHYMEETTN
ncbi:ATP-binding protein [Blautia sp.]